MKFAQAHPISDVCILVTDIEASMRFYVDRLGFQLLHRAPGFADFSGAGLTLALWEREHIAQHAQVHVKPGSASAVLIAVKIESLTVLDQVYEELQVAGIDFLAPPADYPWNARCLYFHGPDGETWELYAWREGGAPGKLEERAAGGSP